MISPNIMKIYLKKNIMKLIKCKTSHNDVVWINIEKITSFETTVLHGYVKIWICEMHHTVEFSKELKKLIEDNLFYHSTK